MTGRLPAAWGSPTAFQQLTILNLADNKLTGTLPSSWSVPDAFASLQYFDLAGNQLTGGLPATWPAQLENVRFNDNTFSGRLMGSGWPDTLRILEVVSNQLTGSMPAELSMLPALQMLLLDFNMLDGTIPEAWGTADAFPAGLTVLTLDGNQLRGTLYDSWGSPNAFPYLQTLTLNNMHVGGTLPDSWASVPGAFQSLRSLYLGGVELVGSIPPSWGSAEAFPMLQDLYIADTYVDGMVPAFNNTHLALITLANCSLTSTLDVFWNSTAPLTQVDLSFNYIEGRLPADAPALHSLQALSLFYNKLQGTVPLSWLQEGAVLSHMPYMQVGQLWDDSVTQVSWRQNLCLKKELYTPDVTAKQISRIPALLKQLEAQTDPNQNLLDGSAEGQLQDRLNIVSSQHLTTFLQPKTNQLTAVQSICANQDAGRWLLALWLAFGGCCIALLGAYVCLRFCSSGAAAARLKRSPCLVRVWSMLNPLSGTTYGLASLTFYYYDLVTSIIVLKQVWGKWPGWVLFAIFLFHFATTGAIFFYHTLHRAILGRYHQTRHKAVFCVCVCIVSCLLSPLTIPVVIVLDTLAFLNAVMRCVGQLARLRCFQWLRPGYVVAARVNSWMRSWNEADLAWVDLESYENMHNLIAAIWQSLPTVILNSVLFSLGNKPSHGVFLSGRLFVAAIIASCLAMLKGLFVVLWEAHRFHTNPIVYTAQLAAGNLLAGPEVQPPARVNFVANQYIVSGSGPLGSSSQKTSSVAPITQQGV